MEINCYNFFFHPLQEQHTVAVKIVSIVTNIVLTILSGGIYVVVFGLVHLKERVSIGPVPDAPQVPSSASQFIGIEGLKRQQREHLNRLQTLAQRGEWQHLQTHTTHPDSGFDWWMFPIDRPSAGYGNYYQVSLQDVVRLKQDPEFMRNYREGVVLVAKSWGWDLENRQDLTSNIQRWTDYQVRLGKMLHSLQLFDQFDLRGSLIYFIDHANIRLTLDNWIQRLL